MRRRALLSSALAGAGALLAACTVTSGNGTATVTIDVAKIHTDGAAIIAAIAALVNMPPLAAALGPNLLIANGALTAAQAALAQFDAMTSGSLSLSVDTTQATNLVNSLITDAQTVLSVIQPVTPSIPGTVGTTVTNYVQAILTLIPFVQAAVAVTSASAAKAIKTPMTEAQALQIATH